MSEPTASMTKIDALPAVSTVSVGKNFTLTTSLSGQGPCVAVWFHDEIKLRYDALVTEASGLWLCFSFFCFFAVMETTKDEFESKVATVLRR